MKCIIKEIKVQSKLLNFSFIFVILIPIIIIIICIYDINTKQMALYQKLFRIIFALLMAYFAVLLTGMRPVSIVLKEDVLLFKNYINWIEIINEVNKFHGLKLRSPKRQEVKLSQIEIVVYGILDEVISVNKELQNMSEVIKLNEYKKAYNMALNKGYVTEYAKGNHIVRYYLYLKEKDGRIHLINLASVPHDRANDLLTEMEGSSMMVIDAQKYSLTT